MRRRGFLAAFAVGVMVVIAVSSHAPRPDAGPRAPVGATRPDIAGHLDAVEVIGDQVVVTGWAGAGDSTTPLLALSTPTGSTPIGRPDRYRPDVEAAYPGGTPNRGFSFALPRPTTADTVCVDALDPASGAPVRLGCGAVDPAAADRRAADLDGLVTDLVAEAERALPGFRVSIAVIPLDTGVTAGRREHELFISASAAKTWWTAAALANGELEAAIDVADAVFEVSSDAAAGVMIDLGGGIDTMNDFVLGLGMEDTAAFRWNTAGVTRIASGWPGPLDGSNHTTARDAAWFAYRLGTNQVLAPPLTDQLLDWMRQSPRVDTDTLPTYFGVGSTLSDSLPPDVRARVAHKAGWLEPGAYAVPGHLLDSGLVWPTNGRPGWAIAMIGAGDGSRSYNRLVQFFEYASCTVYRDLADDEEWTCPTW